jgi:hypothetical protein
MRLRIQKIIRAIFNCGVFKNFKIGNSFIAPRVPSAANAPLISLTTISTTASSLRPKSVTEMVVKFIRTSNPINFLTLAEEAFGFCNIPQHFPFIFYIFSPLPRNIF